MVETQIITSPVFLSPVLAGKGFDGRESPSVKRKLCGTAALGSLWVVRGAGKWCLSGEGHREETGDQGIQVWKPSLQDCA